MIMLKLMMMVLMIVVVVEKLVMYLLILLLVVIKLSDAFVDSVDTFVDYVRVADTDDVNDDGEVESADVFADDINAVAHTDDVFDDSDNRCAEKVFCSKFC